MRRAQIPPAEFVPRLMTAREVSTVLRLSYWSARDLILSGRIPRVLVPSSKGDGVTRRLLVNAADVARLVDEWREPAR